MARAPLTMFRYRRTNRLTGFVVEGEFHEVSVEKAREVIASFNRNSTTPSGIVYWDYEMIDQKKENAE